MKGLITSLLIGFGIALFTTIPLITGFFYYHIPLSYWIEYSAVIPAQDSFALGERPEFISFKNTRRQVYVEWNDRLHCRSLDTDQFVLMGEAVDASSLDVGDKPSNWKLQIDLHKLPTVPSECFLIANITRPAPFEFARKSFDKKQRVVTNKFYYLNK